MMKRKIKLGISSCLLGNNVRYDGGNKRDQYLLDTFGPLVEWVPVCPEVEAGFPVPREPMQLVGDPARFRLITCETKRDRTDAFVSWIEGKLMALDLEHVRGFILKARSPSCGVRDTEYLPLSGESIGRGPGLFSDALMRRFPALPVEDDERLHDAAVREHFLARLFA